MFFLCGLFTGALKKLKKNFFKGHDFVTGWAARGGGRRLRYFRVEVQKQKVGELAKEIWENYLKEVCDRPREAVQEILKCCESLDKLANEIVEMEEKNDGDDEKNLGKSKNEVSSILYFFCKNSAEFFLRI